MPLTVDAGVQHSSNDIWYIDEWRYNGMSHIDQLKVTNEKFWANFIWMMVYFIFSFVLKKLHFVNCYNYYYNNYYYYYEDP